MGCIVNETHPPLYRDHLDGIFAHVEVENRPGTGQNIPEGTRRPDHRIGASIIETGHARCHVHFGQIRIQGDDLNLGAPSDPDPGSVWNDQLSHPPCARKERIPGTERSIPDHGHPVVHIGNVTKKISFDVIHPAHHNARRVRCRGWRNRHHRRGKQIRQQPDHPCGLFHLNHLLSDRLSFRTTAQCCCAVSLLYLRIAVNDLSDRNIMRRHSRATNRARHLNAHSAVWNQTRAEPGVPFPMIRHSLSLSQNKQLIKNRTLNEEWQ